MPSLESKVTLRKERMYDFLDRLVNVVLPRVRDFEGVPSELIWLEEEIIQ